MCSEEVITDGVVVAGDVVADRSARGVAHPADGRGEVELRPRLELVLADPAVPLDVLARLAERVVRAPAAPSVLRAGIGELRPGGDLLRRTDHWHRGVTSECVPAACCVCRNKVQK